MCAFLQLIYKRRLNTEGFCVQTSFLFPDGVVMEGSWSGATLQEVSQTRLARAQQNVQFRAPKALN